MTVRVDYREDHWGTYIERWECEPPPEGTTYFVVRDRWDGPVDRTIFEIEVVPEVEDTVLEAVPNPGSDDAVRTGCICAVLDNCHGRRQPRPDGWFITQGCPLHDPEGGWSN